MVVLVLVVAEVVVLLLLLLGEVDELALFAVLDGLLLWAKQRPVRPRNTEAVTRCNLFIWFFRFEVHFPIAPMGAPDGTRSLRGLI